MERKYAFVAEGDVFMVWSFDTESGEASPQKMEMIMAGLSSDPKIIEIPEGQSVEFGWTYNGTQFEAPKE